MCSEASDSIEFTLDPYPTKGKEALFDEEALEVHLDSNCRSLCSLEFFGYYNRQALRRQPARIMSPPKAGHKCMDQKGEGIS